MRGFLSPKYTRTAVKLMFLKLKPSKEGLSTPLHAGFSIFMLALLILIIIYNVLLSIDNTSIQASLAD